MRISNKAVYVKAYALINMNCASKGDLVHFVKKSDGWRLQNDRIGKSFAASVSHIRNDNIFEVVEILEGIK